jgi:hypothetical protein
MIKTSEKIQILANENNEKQNSQTQIFEELLAEI